MNQSGIEQGKRNMKKILFVISYALKQAILTAAVGNVNAHHEIKNLRLKK